MNYHLNTDLIHDNSERFTNSSEKICRGGGGKIIPQWSNYKTCFGGLEIWRALASQNNFGDQWWRTVDRAANGRMGLAVLGWVRKGVPLPAKGSGGITPGKILIFLITVS